MGKYKKYIIPTIVFTAIFYIAFSYYGNFDRLKIIFESCNWAVLPLLLFISLVNFFVRFLKWHYYLGKITSAVNSFESYLVFNSAMALSFSPGKIGDLIKSYFLKEKRNIEISKTATIVLAERITDITSLLVITILGTFIFGYGGKIIFVIASLFLVIILLLGSPKVGEVLISKLEKFKIFKNFLEPFRVAYNTSAELLRAQKLISMTLLTIVAWSIESLGFYIILINFNIQVSYYFVLFIYSFSILVGSLSMLPAGIGFTESSLTFLLINNGVEKDFAVASTILVRAVTLWFSVVFGLISLFFYEKMGNKR